MAILTMSLAMLANAVIGCYGVTWLYVTEFLEMAYCFSILAHPCNDVKISCYWY